MADITGKFVADFESFFTAVNKAEVELRSFEANSNKVGASLDRMANQFSGRKVIQDATLMAEAVERIGGTSKLTDAELARLSATVGEATAKMRAMGIEVPPAFEKILASSTKMKAAFAEMDASRHMVTLGKETKTADAGLTSMVGTARQLAGAFGLAFGVGASVNFVKGIFESASSLKDLSAQTHIGVEDLQRLAGAMSEFGVDADTLGKSLFTLSRKIAGGDESVEWALEQMGLSLKDVAGLEGKDLFLKIENGLATLKGSLRDTAAAELFGSRLGMAMAGASEDIQGTLDKMNTLNGVMSADTVEALDAAGEAVERASRNFKALAANLMGPVAEGFNYLASAWDKGAGFFNLLNAATLDFIYSSVGAGASTQHLAKVLDELNQKTAANTQVQKDNNAETKKGTKSKAEWLAEKKAKVEAEAEALKAQEKIDRDYRALQNKLGEEEIARKAAELKRMEEMDREFAKFISDRANEDGIARMNADAARMKEEEAAYAKHLKVLLGLDEAYLNQSAALAASIKASGTGIWTSDMGAPPAGGGVWTSGMEIPTGGNIWSSPPPIYEGNAGAAGGATTINMNGLLLSNDPSAREALRKVVGDVTVGGLKRSKLLSY